MQNKKYLLLILLLLALIQLMGCADNVYANANIISINAPNIFKVKKISPFKIATTLQTSTSAHSFNNSKHSAESNLALAASYLLSNQSTIKFATSVTKNLKGLKKQEMENSSISISKSLKKINNSAEILASIAAIIPSKQSTRETKTLYTKFTLTPSLILDLSSIGMKNVSATLFSSIGRGFYQYTRAHDGIANSRYTLKNGLVLAWSFIEGWGLSTTFSNTSAWTFSGTQKKDQYEFAQELSYTLNKFATLSFGHLMGGKTFGYDGQTSNIQVFDANDSSFYTAVGILF